jgi:hypothetical protein
MGVAAGVLGAPPAAWTTGWENSPMTDDTVVPKRFGRKPQIAIEIGTRFERWTVIDPRPEPNRPNYALCRCDCGTERTVQKQHLRGGKTRSCGCLAQELAVTRNRTHGLSNHPLYHVWYDMMQRCTNPSHASWSGYGARGIKVARRWHDVENFIEDLGPLYRPKASLDRIDNNGHYEPGNVRFASAKVQLRNTRRNRLITYRGQTRCLKEWAERLGMSYLTLITRIDTGWSVEDAFERPVAVQDIAYDHNGHWRTLTEWSVVTGIPRATLKARIQRDGWPLERALTEPVHPTKGRRGPRKAA